MQLRELDRDHVWHPYTPHTAGRNLRIPIVAKGSGAFLFDDAGNRYLDGISTWWSCNLGHSHPELLAALHDQASALQHSILGTLSHEPIIRLSKALCEQFADARRHVLYSSDGASAVEAACKVAIQYWANTGQTSKQRLIALNGAYHGDTLGCVSLCFNERIHGHFRGVIKPAIQAPFPACSRNCTLAADGSATACACFAEMEQLITQHASTVAAVVVEPLCQGAGGMRVYTANYLKQLSDCCKRYNVLLICDEIAMGYGRTGKMWAHQHAGIDPDIVTVGKALTNGYLPMSATIVKDYIYDTFSDDNPKGDKTFLHGHTFAGNPLCASVALRVLQIYERDGVVARAQQLGKALASAMDTFRGLPGIAAVRGVGMVGALEFEDRTVSTPQGERKLVDAVIGAMFERRIMLRSLGNVAYIMLPLVVSESIVRETVEALHATVKVICKPR